MPAIFQPRIAKKNQQGTFGQGGHKLIWRDSYKGVGCAETSMSLYCTRLLLLILGRVINSTLNLDHQEYQGSKILFQTLEFTTKLSWGIH